MLSLLFSISGRHAGFPVWKDSLQTKFILRVTLILQRLALPLSVHGPGYSISYTDGNPNWTSTLENLLWHKVSSAER